MFPREVCDMVRSQMEDENWINQEVQENALAASKGEMEGLTSSAVLEASVISTKIGSFWGSADEGLVGAESNT